MLQDDIIASAKITKEMAGGFIDIDYATVRLLDGQLETEAVGGDGGVGGWAERSSGRVNKRRVDSCTAGHVSPADGYGSITLTTSLSLGVLQGLRKCDVRKPEQSIRKTNVQRYPFA